MGMSYGRRYGSFVFFSFLFFFFSLFRYYSKLVLQLLSCLEMVFRRLRDDNS